MPAKKFLKLYVEQEVITVDLSSSQFDELAGPILSKMLYGNLLDNLLCRSQEEYRGCPHDGGQHTLRVTLKPDDFNAFLESIVEAAQAGYFGHPTLWVLRVESFVEKIRSERLPKARLRYAYIPAPPGLYYSI